MKYTLFENDGNQYILHDGVKIFRTEIAPDVFRFKCSLCSQSGASQYNIIRHINSRHKDYITDNAVNETQIEGGKLTEEAKAKRQAKKEAEKEAKRQRAIEFDDARVARKAKIAKRNALKAEIEMGLQNKFNERKELDAKSKEMKNKIQDDVTQRELVDVLRMDTIEGPEDSPESEKMEIETIKPEETPKRKRERVPTPVLTPTPENETDNYSMVFEAPEPTKQNITIEPEIVEEIIEPEVEASPEPIFQKNDVDNILQNVEEIKDIKCKDELQKLEKRYKKKIEKINKEMKGNDCKKELEKLKMEFKTTIKDTIKGLNDGMVSYSDDDMNELIENANKFADSMIDFSKRSENENAKKKIDKIIKRKGGTRKKNVTKNGNATTNPAVIKLEYLGSTSKDKPKNKTSNKIHKRKTKVNKKTRHNKTPANKKPIVRLDSAKLKNLSKKSRMREILKQTNKNKK